MNPSTSLPLDPIARAQAIEAATADAHAAVLLIMAAAVAVMFFLLFARQLIEAGEGVVQRLLASQRRYCVGRALREDTALRNSSPR